MAVRSSDGNVNLKMNNKIISCYLPTAKVVVEVLTCSKNIQCNSGCGAGYKCGHDGCPTCDCIKPAGKSKGQRSKVKFLRQFSFSYQELSFSLRSRYATTYISVDY